MLRLVDRSAVWSRIAEPMVGGSHHRYARRQLSAGTPQEAIMTEDRDALAQWVDDERERIISFLQAFIRCRSPNPPGDTTEAARHIMDFLRHEGLEFRVVAPEATMPNLIAAFDGARGGKHLVLNGHIDVFPV